MDLNLLRQIEALQDNDGADLGNHGAPGRSTLTSRLTPAPQVIFRVADAETARALGESLSGNQRIQREAAEPAGPARDDNGVHEGADAMVERASSASSGTPLPEPVRARFEGSLGADLSAVRVHTGGESAEANQAVGAKAYTVGNDIHFNEGQYRPEDPFGMHLLAHEVAHTVQQSGGASRRQHKLEVSTPHDALEHEADRAADAMVKGARAAVGGGGPKLSRQLAEDMASEANHAEEQDVGNHVGVAVAAGKASTVGDASQAKAMIGEVTGAKGVLMDHLADGPAQESHVLANTTAICTLQSLQETQIIQETGLGAFQGQYSQSVKDYDRILAAVQAYQKMYPNAAGADYDENGELKAGGAATGQEMAKNLGMNEQRAAVLKKSQASHGNVGNRDDGEKSIAEMDAAGKGVKDALDKLNTCTTGMQASSAALNADIGRVPKDDDKAESTKINGEIAQFKGVLSKMLSAVKLVITHSPAGSAFSDEELKEAGRDPSKNLAGDAAEKVDADMLEAVSKAFFAGRAKLASTLDNSKLAEKEYANSRSYVKNLEKAEQELTTATRQYKESVRKHKDAKASMMKRLQRAGMEADRLTGNRGGYEAGSRLVGETSGFLSQVDVTIHHGEQFDKQATKASTEKGAVTSKTYKAEGSAANPLTDPEKHGNSMTDPAGMRWYSWIPTPAYKKRAGLDKSGKGEIATNHIDASSLQARYNKEKDGWDTADGNLGAQATAKAAVEDLKAKQKSITEMRSSLVKAMGLFGNAV